MKKLDLLSKDLLKEISQVVVEAHKYIKELNEKLRKITEDIIKKGINIQVFPKNLVNH